MLCGSGGRSMAKRKRARSKTQATQRNRPRLVVIGSSAGGIEALQATLAGLQPDLPGSIVVAQHLAHEKSTLLADVLRCKLPVKFARRRMPLKPGTVYLGPPDKDVVV